MLTRINHWLHNFLARRRNRLGLIIAITLLVSLGTIQLRFDDSGPVPLPAAEFRSAPKVDASCTVVLNSRYFQDDEETEILTLTITLPDGTPLEGVCITFTRDNGPGAEEEVIGVCTTDAEGRCTIRSPGGVINVHFGNTRIGGIPVNNATDTIDALSDASSGGVGYYFSGDEPAEENIVASESEDGGSISMEHAHEDEDGDLVPYDPGPDLPPGVEWGDWEFPIDYEPPPGIIIGPGDGFNTELPTGIVTVRFTPTVLRTTAAYDRAYCYYATGNSGFTRVPAQTGTFLPGGGTYFDLGAVLNGDARPGAVLEAETENFDIIMECWGFRGNQLIKVGQSSDSQGRELWRGQSLQMGASGLAINYALAWFGPGQEPNNPRLPEEMIGDVPIIDQPGLTGPVIGADQVRFTDRLVAPRDVRLQDDQLQWVYDGRPDIGGFRIYRDGYLVGTAPPNARSWTGDGLNLLACGDAVEFSMTTFSGGAESVGSTPTIVGATNCAAQVTVVFDTVALGDGPDCDGSDCGSTSEMYGYLSVNDQTVRFGGANARPQTTGAQLGQTHQLANLLAPLGATNQISVGVSSSDALNVEIGLFDRDTNTSDDLICAWQAVLPARDSAAWAEQDGRVIVREGITGEATCTFTIALSVE